MKRKTGNLFSRGAVVVQVWSGIFLLLFLVLLPSSIMADTVEEVKNDETPAMVQRHLFSPEEEKSVEKAQGPRSEAAAKLEKELLFTGVIHSPQGKWAIIRPKNKTKREDATWRLREGDEIKGYHIEEIGSNYIILVSKDKPVRLDLYRGSKKRPAAPAEPPPPLTPVPAATANLKQKRGAKGAIPGARSATSNGAKAPVIRRPGLRPPSAAPSAKENAENPATRQPTNSLADILKRARGNNQTGGLPPTNPFSRIIQQQQGK